MCRVLFARAPVLGLSFFVSVNVCTVDPLHCEYALRREGGQRVEHVIRNVSIKLLTSAHVDSLLIRNAHWGLLMRSASQGMTAASSGAHTRWCREQASSLALSSAPVAAGQASSLALWRAQYAGQRCCRRGAEEIPAVFSVTLGLTREKHTRAYFCAHHRSTPLRGAAGRRLRRPLGSWRRLRPQASRYIPGSSP